jgi:sugar transferase EpsL
LHSATLLQKEIRLIPSISRDLWYIYFHVQRMMGLKMFIRLFDIIVALLLLILFSPVMMLISLIIRWQLGSPIFFKQERPGLNGQPFYLIKYRTMLDLRDGEGDLLPDNQRQTRLGRWLRSTSLDELPQLWLVLTGKMSLVGPRPLLMSYLPLYNDYQRRRHNVRPGITGYAQIMGRNHLTWKDKFDYDIWYVENRCLRLNIWILMQTLTVILKRKGIHSKDNEIVLPFTGNIEDN